MEKIHRILAFFLACLLLMLGTGIGVVHICSAYCITQDCSYAPEADSCEEQDLCHCSSHSECNLSDDRVSVSEDCTCINIKYEIPFFSKISQVKPIQFVPVLIELPDFLVCSINNVATEFMSARVSNAPPAYCGSRILLSLHSVLII